MRACFSSSFFVNGLDRGVSTDSQDMLAASSVAQKSDNQIDAELQGDLLDTVEQLSDDELQAMIESELAELEAMIG